MIADMPPLDTLRKHAETAVARDWDAATVCTADNILALLDRIEAAEAKVARAEALADEWEHPAQGYVLREQAAPSLRDALGGQP